MSCIVGLAGLAVMGQNLALNIAEKGYKIAVYNRTSSKVDDCVARAHKEGNLPVEGYKDIVAFAIIKPRKIIVMVQAGNAVDAILEQLLPHLSKGDMVIDGGNEWYEKTEARSKRMEELGFRYMGMGVSGGEEGARHGPALMPGGTSEGYDIVEEILQKIAAQADGEPCVSYIGRGGAGNYVKMVHNGIEYGDMQLISESYEILKKLCGYNNKNLAALFHKWNHGVLQSFLIEITARIFEQRDDVNPNEYLIDKILDVAGSKGTGMWTVQESARRGIPCPTIQAALDMRSISAFKADREAAAALYSDIQILSKPQSLNFCDDVEAALYCSKLCSYAQGMMLLRKASADEGWNLIISEIVRGWKGGCIIRARFLDRISNAYKAQPDIPSLLLCKEFADEIKARIPAWRRVVTASQVSGLSIPAMAASLTYFDAFIQKTLPTNLVQAQRDFFGAHTYQRTDKEGTFHTNWGQI